jgi:hypothetical protein
LDIITQPLKKRLFKGNKLSIISENINNTVVLRLKRLDFFGQMVALLLCVVLGFAVSCGYFLAAYFVIGTWQLVSTIIHRTACTNTLRAISRDAYEKVLLLVLAAGLVSFFTGIIIVYGAILLILSPIMAFWYGSITYTELKLWEARAFVHLK